MRIGFTCGVFDVFHAGHVLMFEECKINCDYLIVAINSAENISSKINPGKRMPVYSLDERKVIIKSCRFVDEVLEYSSEDELYDILNNRKIDVRFLGDDYKGKEITGGDLGIQLHYTNRSHGFSTSSVIQRILERYKGI